MSTSHFSTVLARRMARFHVVGRDGARPGESAFGADPSAFTGGQIAEVTTHDTGPSGNLNVRGGPGTNNAIVGTIPHGGTVRVRGASQSGQGATGWVPIEFPANSGKTAFGAADFLTPLPQGTAPAPSAPLSGQVDPNIKAPFPVRAVVTTHDTGPAGDLNVHATPSTSGRIVGKVAHASFVSVTGGPTQGQGSAGWFQIGPGQFVAGEFLRASPLPAPPVPPPTPIKPAPNPTPQPPSPPPAPAEKGPNVPLIAGALVAATTLAVGGYYLTKGGGKGKHK